MKNHVILIGKPGTGKGTLAKQLLANDTDFIHLSTGDVFRRHINNQTDLGMEIEDVMKSGGLVNDELTIAVVEDFMFHNQNKRIIFDGFPRNTEQTIWLLNELTFNNQPLPYTIYLKCDNDSILVERIMSRAKELNRAEDKELNTILRRLSDYEEITEHAVNTLCDVTEDLFVTVDAEIESKKTFKFLHSLLIHPS